MPDLEQGMPRMLREMAQQMRLLECEKRSRLNRTRHVRDLADQLEQHADILEAKIGKRRLH